MQRQRAAHRLGHWSNDPPAGPFMARSGARPHINVILRIRVNIGFPPALRYVVAAFWGKNQANRIRRPTIMGNTSTVRIASAMLAIAIAGTAAPAQAQTTANSGPLLPVVPPTPVLAGSSELGAFIQAVALRDP